MVERSEDAVPKKRSSKLGWLLRGALAAGGVIFIVVELRRSLAGHWHELVPTWPRALVALLFVLIGLLSGAVAWSALFGEAGRSRHLVRGFFLATLARYVPGGIWQPLGQVGSAAGSGVPMANAIVAFPVNAVVLIAAGGVLATGVAFTITDLPLVFRLLCGCGVLLVVFLRRSWMAWFLNLARRFVRRIPAPEAIPDQAAILRSFVFNVVNVGFTGAAFAVLAKTGIAGVFAFGAAWTIGFALLPLPSGLGVREAILVGLLPIASSRVLSAAVSHRVAIMVVELVVASFVAVDSVVRRERAPVITR